MSQPRPPRSRNDFEIALICAVGVESNAVEAIFDGFWEGQNSYGKAPGDSNAYTTGWIHGYNVVLAYLPGMGRGPAAAVAARFRPSFPNIKLGLLVGICGGSPASPTTKQEIMLGDVVISTGVIQYDFGRQFPDKVVRKDTLEDNLGRPNGEIRSFLMKLQNWNHQQLLKQEAWTHLEKLQRLAHLEAIYPGSEKDKLFESTYRHKHHYPEKCVTCAACKVIDANVCESSRDLTCDEVGCSDDNLVQRKRKTEIYTNQAQNSLDFRDVLRPVIHFGRIASGDLIMKSGHHRDEIAAREKIIAFEMEGAGVWDNFPTIVIKAVCDYADSHKNKMWQHYAAASAAAHTKALLTQWRASDPLTVSSRSLNTVPLNMVYKFVGRLDLLEQIDYSLFGASDDNDRPQVLILQAMGGQGKTQLALQACERSQNTHEGIFWANATSRETAERAFESLADKLNTTGQLLSDANAKVKFVFDHLRSWDQRWLLVLDNFDLVEEFKGIRDFIPQSRNGTIIITSRNEGASRLGEVIHVPSMIEDNGEEILLRQYWDKKGTSEETDAATKIVKRLGGLALALSQAASYINFSRMTLSNFDSRYESKKRDIMKHRPDLFEYHSDAEEPISVFTTWEMSFDQIEPNNAEWKSFIEDFLAVSACLDPRYITEDIFQAHQEDTEEFFEWQQLFVRQHDDDSSGESESEEISNSNATQGRSFTRPNSQNWSSKCFRNVIGQLRKIGLLQQISDTQNKNQVHKSFSIHPVIKDWLQKRKTDTRYRKQIVRQCIEIIVAAIKKSSVASSSPAKRKRLLEHLDACLLAADSAKLSPGIGSIDMRQESFAISIFFRNEGQYAKSRAILEQLVMDDEQNLSAENKDRLNCLDSLASVLYYQGQFETATALYKQLIEIQKRVLGEEHPDTLTSISNLALNYSKQGRLEEAEILEVQVLEISKRVLGEEHPDTLTRISNLASTYSDQGRNEEAEILEVQVLEISKRVLGEEHPLTLIKISNLAWTYSDQGRYEEAEILDLQVLEIRKQVLGEEHPSTITSMENLAITLHATGRTGDAVGLLRTVYSSRVKTIGPDHLKTKISAALLSIWESSINETD